VNLSPDQKIAGVLAPLFALRTETDLGIKVGLLINFGRTKVEHKPRLLICVSSVSICG
jgi:hypothetical protein